MSTVKTNLSKLGKIVSIEEALEASNLNFVAHESEMMGADCGIFAPDHKMLYRTGYGDVEPKVLGIVGTKYHAVQNSLAMAFMDSVVQEHGFTYAEALSKDEGAVSTIVARSEKSEAVRVGDEVQREIKIYNGFNGKTGLAVEFSMLRLVCTNGMVRGERESVIRFRHTAKVNERMAMALQVFDQSVTFHEDFVAKSKMLAETAVNKEMVETFLKGLFTDAKQNDSKKNIIEDLAQTGMGNNGSSLWDFYNGATEYVDHVHGASEKRDGYVNFGAGHKLKEKAWNTAMSLV